MIFWVVVILAVIGLGYIRFAPTDVMRWHVAAKAGPLGEKKLKNGYIWRRAGTEGLQALDEVARATPRTEVLAGSVEEGQVTYVTRSLLFGFPDYTTVGVQTDADGQPFLEIFGRLRFGKSDLGVNAKRIKGWVAAAKL